MGFIAAASGATLVWLAFNDQPPIALQLAIGVTFTLSIVVILWLTIDPEGHSANQSDELLKLASHMLNCAKDGLTQQAAQEICELLLPATAAIAVAITDREVVLGYAGYNAENNRPGREIRTTATKDTLQDGKPRILYKADDIGLPMSSARINAAIVQPLYIGQNIVGTMKFYYRRAGELSRTQQSVAHGLAELLGTQMAASALEEQKKLATSMELKALQAQINPHFLFNTINTIASLIRTDPMKARDLLRDFAVFYRSTLEDSDDLIPFERELKQVERYFSFEVARFGEDRLRLEIDVEQDLLSMLIPSFMIQPLVENAVKHAMRAEGMLTVRITGAVEGDDIVICVIDDGVGMSEETIATMMSKESTTGLGIAVKNVQDRVRGNYGTDSRMEVTSEVGKGTTVMLMLDYDAAIGIYAEREKLKQSTVPDIPSPVVTGDRS
jgi:two-component system sensor histidine kinase LytS